MIFHVSIDADDPQRVGAAIARLWRGEALPFPPVAAGSVIVMAGDHRNSAIEIYPRGVELEPADGDADAVGPVTATPARGSATHAAISTPLTLDEVMAIAAEEGWPAKYRKRGGLFGVVEMWIEGRLMLEVLTPQMQAEYLAAMTPDGWRAALADGPPPTVAV